VKREFWWRASSMSCRWESDLEETSVPVFQGGKKGGREGGVSDFFFVEAGEEGVLVEGELDELPLGVGFGGDEGA